MVEVFFTDNVIESISVLNQIGRGFEWSGELWGEIVGELIIVNDLLILKQIVSSVGVNSGLDNRKRVGLRAQSLFYYSKTGRLVGKQMVGWIHSHDDMTAFLSATDRIQVESVYLKEIPFLVSVVISSKSKTYKRKRFGFMTKEKKLPFTIKMWYDGRFKKRDYSWHETKFQPGKNFSFTVLNEKIDKNIFSLVKADYDQMVEKKKSEIQKTNVLIDRSALAEYFA
jgi:proteasome lid subunit RPN8/RPN11